MALRYLWCLSALVCIFCPIAYADNDEYTRFPVRIILNRNFEGQSIPAGELDIDSSGAKLQVANVEEENSYYKRKSKGRALPKIQVYTTVFRPEWGQLKKVYQIAGTSFIFTDKKMLLIMNARHKDGTILKVEDFQLSDDYYSFGKIVGVIRWSGKIYIARQSNIGRLDEIHLETGKRVNFENFFYGIETISPFPSRERIVIGSLHTADTVDSWIGRSGQLYYVRELNLSGGSSEWTGDSMVTPFQHFSQTLSYY